MTQGHDCHESDIDRYEILWRDADERRKANDNAACGYAPETEDNDEDRA